MVERFLTQLLLRRPPPAPDAAALTRRLAALGAAGAAPPQLVSAEWPVMVQLGQEMLVAMRVEAPLPGTDELAGAAWWWPEASAAVRGHAAHLIVWAMGAERPGVDAVAAARTVGRFTAALAATLAEEAVAVCWGGAGTLWSPEQFARAVAQPLPVMLWVRFDLTPGCAPGEAGVATRGLRPFLDCELRLEPTALLAPAQAAQRCHGLAAYLLGGAVVEEGDSIGIDGHERIRVRRDADESLGGTVMSLTVERPSG